MEKIFRDDGYSGASLKRPGLDRLRDQAAARTLDLVLITAPDRLARNYVHQVLLLEELEQHGCQVQFLDRPMSHDPHDQLLLQIRGAVAEYERTLITERMRRGRQRKLAAGLLLPWTKPPFGYRVDPDRPRDPAGVRIEESEAAIVREMFAWYAEESHSFCSLARLLYERGLRTAQGLERWNLASIRGLLTNPAYMGRGNWQPPASSWLTRTPLGYRAEQAFQFQPCRHAPRTVDPGGANPGPCQRGTVGTCASPTGGQPPLCPAQQQSPSLLVAESGKLRRLRAIVLG